MRIFSYHFDHKKHQLRKMQLADVAIGAIDLLVNNVYTHNMAKKAQQEDPVMVKVRGLFEKSGMSLHDLGIKMDCSPETARQAVWQFMRTSDPHISVLRRFAKALDVPLSELLDEKKAKAK